MSIKSLRLTIVERSLDGASGSVLFQTDGVKMETERNKGTERKRYVKRLINYARTQQCVGQREWQGLGLRHGLV